VRPKALYTLYGLALASPFDLPCPVAPGARRADVRLRAGRSARFAALRPRTGAGRPSREWFFFHRVRTGSTYLRWKGLFEFLVSADGHDIRFHRLPRATSESLSTYLLGQVLSFSLLAFGVEPLHGTVVEIDGEAVAFLGDCGYGKSTLGAAFLSLGYPILTDDLIVLESTATGYAVQPGMPRLKLFPSVARRVLGIERSGPRLNAGTSKQILPLAAGQVAQHPAPLRALYVLSEPTRANVRTAGRVRLERVSGADALLEVIKATFNTVVVGRDRLARQFAFANALAAAVPVTRLSYPRNLSLLPAVCEAVLADLS
jgi:hypothetical protein